jgi:hypothetical protein
MCIPVAAIVPTLAKVGTTIGTFLGGAGVAGAAGAGAAGASAAAGGIGTALTLASGGLTAYSQYRNARMAETVANRNAEAQDRAAIEAMREGEERSTRQRQAAAVFQGQQRVGMAANGIDVTSAGALGMLDETKLLAEEDAFAIRETARRVAGNADIAATNARVEAQSQRSASFFEPVGTILGTASKVGQRYAYMSAGYA